MPDRLVDLYQHLADRVEGIDALMKAADRGDERDILAAGGEDRRRARDRFSAQWDELAALVGRQRSILGVIVKQAEEISSLSAFLQTDHEREKARLARELHEQLGCILTPAKMDLSWLQARLGDDPQYAQRLARLSALIDQEIDLKRRFIEDLHPSLLDHLGLAAAVQWYVDETCGAANIGRRVTIAKLERLPSDLEIALYRVVQESVTNVIRHAKAKNVELVVERNDKGLRVAIRDDGVGIEDMDQARKLSHGLTGMTQRMRAIHGTLDIRSRPGGGTQVEAFLPIAA
ncbi:MAG TPA: sensor histidine kinase [Usitatibacter sp.]